MSLPPLLRCSNRGVGSTAFEPGFARKKQWGSELTRGQWEKPHRSTSLPGYVNPLWRGLYYSAFRSRFGPDKLKNLDGEALLYTLHDFQNRDSLVYWLEFKDDDDFPSKIFGSISGGSSFKFGLFRKKETGVWTSGAPGNPVELSL